MKICTVLSNHYDYHSFTDWIMTTISLEEVNAYLNDIKLRGDQIRINVPYWEDDPVFFVEDTEYALPYNKNCASKEQRHVVVMVKEV